MWRYFPYERLLDLLLSEELFFTHLPNFSDGLEGKLTARTRDHLFNWFVGHGSDFETARQELALYEKHQEQFYASCWHMNDSESYLMWKAYGDRGFAVRTTFERMQASFEDFPGTITGGVVDYIDFEREKTPVGNVFNHVITKDKPYRDEREFRLIFWQPAQMNQSIVPGERGIRVRVNLRMLVERVYTNPISQIDTAVMSELSELLDLKGIELSSSLIKQRCR